MLAVFEDESSEDFYPVTLTRPVFELKCGASTVYEKISRLFPGEDTCFFARDYLAPALRSRTGAPVNEMDALTGEYLVLANGRWLPSGKDDNHGFRAPAAYFSGEGDLLCGCFDKNFLRGKNFGRLKELLAHVKKSLPAVNLPGETLLKRPWDIIENNSGAIRSDFLARGESGIHCRFPSQSSLVGDEDGVFIHGDAVIHPCVVIDSTGGPVTVDKAAVIYPNTWIQGPAYIGAQTQVFGAKIREGVSAGPVCRLGGEIEETVIHGFTNKYHDGFLGHSYLGEFINLGAGTITSDLRIDYGETDFYTRGKFRPTGRTKVGAFIGDHAKTGVTSVINTASSIGVLSIVLGVESVIPRFIPSCSWYIKRKITRGFGFEKLLEGARAQMQRRDRQMGPEETAMLEKVYEITAPEREAAFKLYSRV